MLAFETSNPQGVISELETPEPGLPPVYGPGSPAAGMEHSTGSAAGSNFKPGRVGPFDLVAVGDLWQAETIWRDFQPHAWHSPFQDFDWVKAWAGSLADTREIEPVIVFGYERNKLVFILPLMRERGHGIWRLTWLANEVNDLNAPLVQPEILNRLDRKTAGEILLYAARCGGGVDICHVMKQPGMLCGQRNPFVATGSATSSCSTHILPLHYNWPQLYRQLRTAKSRSRQRQKENRLNRQGNLRFQSLRDPQRRTEVIEQILQWKSNQLAGRGDRDPFAAAPGGTHANSSLKQTILNCAGPGTQKPALRVYGLFLDDRLIAGMVAFVGKKRFSLLTTSYDPDIHTNCSVGVVLLTKTIQLAARAGLDTYDFLAGDEAYKLQWCRQHVKLYESFAGVTRIGLIAARAQTQKYKLKKMLKSSPPMMNMLRRTNFFRVQVFTFFAGVQGS